MENIVSFIRGVMCCFRPGYTAAGDLRGCPAFFRFAFMSVVFILPLAVFAEARDTVRVGYYENEVFQEGAREGAMKTGYAYEYYRKLSEYTGWKYEYVYGEFAQLYQMLLDGKIDLMAGLAWKKERQGLIGYPEAPMGSESYNLVKHSSDESITADPKTLDGKTIGVLDSALLDALNRYLARNHVSAKVETFKDNTALFAAFDSGKIDVLAAEGNGMLGRSNTEILVPFGGSSYFVCVNVRRPDLLAKLNNAQAALSVEDPTFLPGLNLKYYPKTILARAISRVERQWLQTHRTLRVGFLENYMPYSGKDSTGQVTGVVKDIIPEIFASLGISSLKIDYSGYGSYDAMIADMAAGLIDVAFPVGGGLYFAEMSGLYQSIPVTSMSTELIYKGPYTENTTKHFAVNKNNRMQYYFILNNFPDSKVTMYPSIEACLDAVLSGEVSCTTLNGLRAHDMLKNRKYKDLFLHHLDKNDDRCFGVVTENRGLLKLLNRGLGVIGRDYVQKKSHRYTHTLYSYRLMDALFDHLKLFGSLLGVVATVIIALLVRDAWRTRRQMAEKEAAGERLAETNRQLTVHAETIERQREQETELREQLEKKQDELKDALLMTQSANRAKTTFLSNMSHDIRTPMNAIIGFTGLAANHIDDKERVKDCLATIKQSSEHLLSLINDVLDVSRIESGKITLNERIESLPDIVQGIRDIVLADVRAKQHSFLIDTEDVRNDSVYCDRLYLNRVLLNLVSNAIKYTHPGGIISLRVRQKPSASPDYGTFEFRVKDNGIGMSEDFLATIFDPFAREEDSTVAGIQGTGLGMTITRSIVQTMGGQISVSSKKGEGTEFVVTLDLRLADGKSSGPAVPGRKSSAAHEKETNGEKQDFSLKGKRVLMVDDSKLNLKIGVLLLQERGMVIDTAPNGQAAVDMVREKGVDAYDFILMDVQMPVMGGYEATSILRKLPDGDKLKIIAFSANAFEEDREKSLKAGMNGHINKPLKIDELIEAFKSASEKS